MNSIDDASPAVSSAASLPPTRQATLSRDPAAAMLINYLAQYEAACPLCGYNLRGLRRPQCPECGKALTLTVGLREPFYAAWIMSAVSSFACGGIGVFFLIMVCVAGLPPAGGNWVRTVLSIVIFGFIATIPIAVATLLLRRRFLRLERQSQWVLALFVLGGSLMLFGTMILVMIADM